MKKITTLAFLLLTLFVSGQDYKTLKNITIGKKTSKEVLKTTVAGISGSIVIQKLKDNRVWGITFISEEINKDYSDTKISNFSEAIQERYNIAFTEDSYSEDDDMIYFTSEKYDISYSVGVSFSKKYGVQIFFMMSDNNLYELHKKEKKADLLNDF